MTETKSLADELEVRGNLVSTECEGDESALAEFGEYVLDNLPLILTTLREAEGMRVTLENISTLSDPSVRIEAPRINLDAVYTIARLALSQGGGE